MLTPVDLQLAGRAYFVTGGTRGIGQTIVSLLLAEGASVATCARSIPRTTAPDQASAGEGARLLRYAVDVRDADALERAVTDAARHFGRLDGVVANAGAGSFGAVLDTPYPIWQEQFEIKVAAVLNLVRPAIALLAESDSGAIVIINGVTAHAPEPGMAAVSAARAAVANLARSLAVELGPADIRVNTVNLGAIVTERQRARHAASGTDEPFDAWCAAEAVRRRVLLRRLGRPEEVAPVAAFLLAPVASYLTGTSIDVSGGGSGRT